jgi:isocitrate dehydrogenase
MTDSKAKIIYTETDEAPALATYSLLPIVAAFTKAADVAVETRDISLAARVIASFSEFLAEDQRVSDDLAELGELAKQPDAKIAQYQRVLAAIDRHYQGTAGKRLSDSRLPG